MKRWRAARLAFLLAVALSAPAVADSRSDASAGVARTSAEPAGAASPALGRRIHREGRLPSGGRLRATVGGDVPLAGAGAACATCHGRSGLGSGEGRAFVPAITAEVLLVPRDASAFDPRGVPASGPRLRPAYDAASFARAVRDGVDPSGRRLGALMPRYALGDADARHLFGYLSVLSGKGAPGVTDTTLRFATVVSDGVAPDERDAMLEVLRAYVAARNAETRSDSARMERGAWPEAAMRQAFRRWELDVWRLAGPPASWRGQLERHDRERPVFALVGGIAAGPWQPIHDFCEARELPCVFPHTDLPPDLSAAEDTAFYSVYFSRGVGLEADVLVRHLVASGATRAPVIQTHGVDGAAIAAARRFRAAFAAAGGHVEDISLDALRAAPRNGCGVHPAEPRRAILVAWLDAAELAALRCAGGTDGGLTLYLSSSLLGEGPASIPEALRTNALLVHPFALPADAARSLQPARRWLERGKLRWRSERVQGDAYFAATLVRRAVQHIAGSFSREYFLETLEHQAESSHSTSVYPRLGLGRGQRFASKGAYVVRVSDGSPPDLEPIGPWIVP